MLDMDALFGGVTLLTQSLAPWAVVPPGILIGLIGGAIPGLSGTMVLALVLPFTIWMDFLPAVLFLLSVFTGAGYGGAVPSILINLPGTPAAVAASFDGYPMSKQGFHNEALGLGLAASSIGVIASYFLLILFLEPLAYAVVRLGPVEMFVVVVWGLTMIAALHSGSLAKGLFAGFLGILFGTVGMSVRGYVRGTWDIPVLIDGIPLIPAMIGLLAASELFNLAKRDYVVASEGARTVSLDRLVSGMIRVFRYPSVLLKGSIVGAAIGAVPGVGAAVANLISYAEAKRADPLGGESYGKGAPEGVVAAESANSSSEGGAMAILLTLGIPGGGGTAILLAAFALHNVTGGPRFVQDNKEIIYAILMSNIAQGIVMLIIGVIFLRIAASIVRTPILYIVPSVLVLSTYGSYSIQGDLSGPITLFIFSVLGWAMRQNGYPVAAAVVGLILGGMAEEELIRSYQISGGNPAYFLGRPVALVLAAVVLLSLFWRPIKRIWTAR